MKITLFLMFFFYSLELFANHSLQTLKNHPNLDGAVISYCTLDKKACGKIDRSRSDLSIKHALELFQKSAHTIEKITQDFDYLNLTYKTEDLPLEQNSLKFSYTRAKPAK